MKGKKGQVFSLDFLISLILIVLAIGIIIQLSEINSYETKEKQVREELEMVGGTAKNLLLTSPSIVCGIADIRDNEIIGYMNGCYCSKPINKEFLGLPEGYNCNISGNAGITTDCTDNPINAKNVYSAEIKAVFAEGGTTYITKDIYQNCINGNGCSLKEGTIKLKVWKA